MNNDLYYVAEDYQHTDFGMQRNYTIQEWREQALEWADMDENDGLIETLNTIKDEDLLDFISEIWQIRFEKGCWQGLPINNIYGLEMYYIFDGIDTRLNILDSDGRYYTHLDYYDDEDIAKYISMLETLTIQELCYGRLFNAKLYNSLEELQYDLQDNEITENNDYVNIFKVNDKKYYVWSD